MVYVQAKFIGFGIHTGGYCLFELLVSIRLTYFMRQFGHSVVPSDYLIFWKGLIIVVAGE